MKFITLSIFIVFFSLTIFSQDIKTAKVNTDAFEDEKTGIKELIDVLAKLKIEFKPQFDELHSSADKITEFGKEIHAKYKDTGTSCPIGPSKIQEEADIFEKLVDGYKENQKSVSFLFNKRKKEITESINEKIRIKLAEFIKINGFVFIYDAADVNSIVKNDESVDVTQEFINFCNEEFEK